MAKKKVESLGLDIKRELFWEFKKELKIGHIRADFNDGGLHNSWIPAHDQEERVKKHGIDLSEVQKVVNDIMFNHYMTLEKVQEVCGGCLYSDESKVFITYGKCNYWVRFIPVKGDYNMYINVYAKELS